MFEVRDNIPHNRRIPCLYLVRKATVINQNNVNHDFDVALHIGRMLFFEGKQIFCRKQT